MGKYYQICINRIKSCVKQNNDISGLFTCVILGENLSPFLFSIFLADLEDFLLQNQSKGLRNIKNLCQEELRIVFIVVLLYAHDTIILFESATDLQNSLDVFESYCSQWKLSVNVEKTKAMIFCKCKERQQYESNIEIVESHSYLGLTFNICKKIKKLAEKAQKALYALYSKTRNLNIPIDL